MNYQFEGEENDFPYGASEKLTRIAAKLEYQKSFITYIRLKTDGRPEPSKDMLYSVVNSICLIHTQGREYEFISNKTFYNLESHIVSNIIADRSLYTQIRPEVIYVN